MNQINEFFTTYLTETIALIFVVLLVLLYVIVKQKSDKPKDLKEHQALKKDDHKPVHIFSDVKAGKDQEEVVKETQEITKEVHKEEEPALKIINKKRELSAHGPITKDSFKIFEGSKILVAEDNMINQKVINGILGDSGMRIVIVNDGQEALDILKEDKDFSIILMDAHMPRVDGYEATKRIREDSSLDHVLVVALSGETSTDDIRKMYNVGMQEHLEKPLKMEKLYEVIYCYIDMKNDVLDEEEKNKDKEPLKKQNSILNIEEGIEICGGDNELYKEVLSEFLTMYEDADQKINSLMAKDQIDAVKELLLDISGISANIGADSLADITTEFREILNNNQEDRFFEIQEKFKDILSQVIGDITAHMH